MKLLSKDKEEQEVNHKYGEGLRFPDDPLLPA